MLLLLFLTLLSTSTAEETEIRKLLESRETAWEMQNIAGLIAPFADDSDYIDSSGKITTGRNAIESQYRKLFNSAKYKYSRSTQKITKVRLLGLDSAVVTAEWTLSGLRSNSDRPLPDRKGCTSLVLTKIKNEWKIISLHVANIQDEKAE